VKQARSESREAQRRSSSDEPSRFSMRPRSRPARDDTRGGGGGGEEEEEEVWTSIPDVALESDQKLTLVLSVSVSVAETRELLSAMSAVTLSDESS